MAWLRPGGNAAAPWRGRPMALLEWSCAGDGPLQVEGAEEGTSSAAVLSRGLAIQMCSFKCDHQLKVVNGSRVWWWRVLPPLK